MNLRRRALCFGAAAAAFDGMGSAPVFSYPLDRQAVLGLGGAGRNVLERLRGLSSFPRNVMTASVNASDSGRDADLQVPRLREGSFDLRRVREVLGVDYAHVILIASLSGDTGYSLLRCLSQTPPLTAKLVTAVAIAPFEFEAKRHVVSCRQIPSSVVKVVTLDNEKLAAGLPPSMTWASCLESLNTQIAAVVTHEVLRYVKKGGVSHGRKLSGVLR